MEGQVRVVLASFLTESEFVTGQGNQVSVFIYLGEESVLSCAYSWLSLLVFLPSSGLPQIGLLRAMFLFLGCGSQTYGPPSLSPYGKWAVLSVPCKTDTLQGST